MIKNYNDFIAALLDAGFSMASGDNDEGIFKLIQYGWKQEPDDYPLRWYSGDPDTDPASWSNRVLERGDIAYGKMFFRKSGYMTKEWWPYFLVVRRSAHGGNAFDSLYADGKISQAAKRIYDLFAEHDKLALHEIKPLAGFAKEEKSKFDNALTELQMYMFITICGNRQKTSQTGDAYGWPSNVFCTTERFFGDEVFARADKIKPEEAIVKITEQIYKLNPSAAQKKINKFIKG